MRLLHKLNFDRKIEACLYSKYTGWCMQVRNTLEKTLSLIKKFIWRFKVLISLQNYSK